MHQDDSLSDMEREFNFQEERRRNDTMLIKLVGEISHRVEDMSDRIDGLSEQLFEQQRELKETNKTLDIIQKQQAATEDVLRGHMEREEGQISRIMEAFPEKNAPKHLSWHEEKLSQEKTAKERKEKIIGDIGSKLAWGALFVIGYAIIELVKAKLASGG